MSVGLCRLRLWSKGCPNKCNGHGICKVTTDATTGKAKALLARMALQAKDANERCAHTRLVASVTMLDDASKGMHVPRRLLRPRLHEETVHPEVLWTRGLYK